MSKFKLFYGLFFKKDKQRPINPSNNTIKEVLAHRAQHVKSKNQHSCTFVADLSNFKTS